MLGGRSPSPPKLSVRALYVPMMRFKNRLFIVGPNAVFQLTLVGLELSVLIAVKEAKLHAIIHYPQSKLTNAGESLVYFVFIWRYIDTLKPKLFWLQI